MCADFSAVVKVFVDIWRLTLINGNRKKVSKCVLFLVNWTFNTLHCKLHNANYITARLWATSDSCASCEPLCSQCQVCKFASTSTTCGFLDICVVLSISKWHSWSVEQIAIRSHVSVTKTDYQELDYVQSMCEAVAFSKINFHSL